MNPTVNQALTTLVYKNLKRIWLRLLIPTQSRNVPSWDPMRTQLKTSLWKSKSTNRVMMNSKRKKKYWNQPQTPSPRSLCLHNQITWITTSRIPFLRLLWLLNRKISRCPRQCIRRVSGQFLKSIRVSQETRISCRIDPEFSISLSSQTNSSKISSPSRATKGKWNRVQRLPLVLGCTKVTKSAATAILLLRLRYLARLYMITLVVRSTSQSRIEFINVTNLTKVSLRSLDRVSVDSIKMVSMIQHRFSSTEISRRWLKLKLVSLH